MTWINQDVLTAAGVDLSTADELSDHVTLFTIPGGEAAMAIWQALAGRAANLGGWPVICGEPDERDRLEEQLEFNGEDPAGVLATVPTGSVADILGNADDESEWGDDEEFEDDKEAESEDADWPVDEADREPMFAVLGGVGIGKPPAKLLLAVVRTTEPAAVVAYLGFGDSNDGHTTAEHVAMLRHWHETHDAVPAVVTHDVIELFVRRPVVTREEAETIAAEQYAYCPDIVDQGTETVGRLAAELFRSPQWFFWWD